MVRTKAFHYVKVLCQTILIAHISVTALQVSPIFDSRYLCSIAFIWTVLIYNMNGA